MADHMVGSIEGAPELERGEPTNRFLLHCDPSDGETVGPRLGVALASSMLRSTTSGGWTSLHLAPDEWLLLGPTGAETLLEAPVDAPPFSLVDVTDRFIAIDLVGERSSDILAVVSPIDFALEYFPINGCTRAPFGKMDMTIWRRGGEDFQILVGRSFHPYAVALLAQARADIAFEHGLGAGV